MIARLIVPNQMNTNLGKTFLPISSIRKIAVTRTDFGESVCIVTFFLFSDSGYYLLKGFDFLSILNGVTLKTINCAFFLEK